MAKPNKILKLSLHSRLCNSLKNHLIDKFEILIHSIDPKLFFVKSLPERCYDKRRHL